MESIKYKAIQMEKFKGKLEVKELELRELKANEVLVKVMCSSILPADLALLQGTYGLDLPTLPIIPGMEGSGIIERVGTDVDTNYIGKHVSLFSNSSSKDFSGLWSQYNITTIENLVVFNTKIEFEKIVNVIGNPLTAVGFIDTLKKLGKKSVAHTGASSAFGRMFMRLCLQQGIDVVNIVRKEQSIKELSEDGGKHFINTSVKGWEEELKKKCEELDITVLFECCGGSITGKCLSAIKQGGIIYHFGNLELKRLDGIHINDLKYGGKTIEGWWLYGWIMSSTKESIENWKSFIVNDFENDNGKLFSTKFEGEFKLEELEKAFETYITKGTKILFKPWKD